MDKVQIEILAEGLKSNHTILGIHLKGNEGDVDAKGFVHQENSMENYK